MASSISWRKLAEYNKNGDMYLLVLLDAMWMNKKMKVHNGPHVSVKAAPKFKDILDDMDVINEQVNSEKVKPSRLRKAVDNVKTFVTLSAAKISTIKEVVPEFNKLFDKVGEFISSLS